MSTLSISYEDLNDAAHHAKKVAEKLEDYAEHLENKVCRKITQYSGERTENLYDADDFMRKKLEKLTQKKIDFTTLSSNIKTFKSNCKIADNNVSATIKTLSGDFKSTYGIKDNIVTNFFNYIGVAIGNATALGRAIKDGISGIKDVMKAASEVIKDWYKYDGGKYLVEGIIEGLGAAALAAITAIGAVAAFAAGGAVIVTVAAVIVAVAAVANGVSAVYNDIKAYQVDQNGDAATAKRYANRDTLGETLRKESDNKLVHNFATGFEIVELGASLVLIVDAGVNLVKGVKNLTRKIFSKKGIGVADDIIKGGSEVTLYDEFNKIETTEAKYKYLLDKAKTMDVSTEKNGAIFYAGRVETASGTKTARQIAENYVDKLLKNKGVVKLTLERTPGGKWMDDLKLYDTLLDGTYKYESLGLSKTQANSLWDVLSSRYADGASGAVTAFSKNVPEFIKPKTVFWSTELPNLINNPNVTHINIR